MKDLVVLVAPTLWSAVVLAQTAISSPESFLVEAGKQVPALVVLAWIVSQNHKDRKELEQIRAKIEEARIVADQEISRRVLPVLERASEMLGRAAFAIEHGTPTTERGRTPPTPGGPGGS